jgi:hypothetical protein
MLDHGNPEEQLGASDATVPPYREMLRHTPYLAFSDCKIASRFSMGPKSAPCQCLQPRVASKHYGPPVLERCASSIGYEFQGSVPWMHSVLEEKKKQAEMVNRDRG